MTFAGQPTPPDSQPDIPPGTAQASRDELAALYLKGRDVPCPNCGYNRRNGTSAACPECGRWIPIGVQPTGAVISPARLIYRLVLAIAIISLLAVALHTISLAAYSLASIGGTWPGGVPTTFIVYSAILLCLNVFPIVFAITTARRIKSLDPRTDRPLRLTVLFFVLAQTPPVLYQLYQYLIYLITL